MLMRSRARRLLFVAAIAGIAAVAAVATPVARAHGCPPTGRASTPFTSWGDDSTYLPMLWGGRGSQRNNWSVAGGAGFVTGNDPYSVDGSSALYLPPGSSSTSSDTCNRLLVPVVRFFVQNAGSDGGLLHVELIVNDGRGGVIDGGTISASDGWDASPQIVMPTPDTHGSVAYAIRLTPVGDGAAFLVDDVYIDPYLSR